MEAIHLKPEALELLSRVRESRARGERVLVSSSRGIYALALDLKRLGLLTFVGREVRNHIAYYEVTA